MNSPQVQVSAEVVLEGGATECAGVHFAGMGVVGADVSRQGTVHGVRSPT